MSGRGRKIYRPGSDTSTGAVPKRGTVATRDARTKAKPTISSHARDRTSKQSPSSHRIASAHSVNTDTEDEGYVENDVKFTNVPSEWEKEQERIKAEAAAPKRTYRKIVTKDILEQCQESDPMRIYEITLHAASIAKIENLEKFPRLRVLDLSCNYIENMENFDKNQDLRDLKLYDNQIQEIGNLQRLTELCHLQLQHNKIKGIGKGLSNQKKLKILRLDSNRLIKLESRDLAACSQLTCLDISSNKLDNIAALNTLPNLEELYASNNRLKTVPDLGRCKKLQEVDFSSNRLTDVIGLKALPKLTVLDVSNNQFANLKSVGKLKSLQELNLACNRITELTTITEQFPNLEILNVSENHLEHWKNVLVLSSLPALVELFLAGNPFCAPNGPKPHYMNELHHHLANLEIIDGAHVKKVTGRGAAPVMRPMSAASVLSARQVASQLSSLELDMSSFESDLMSKMDSLRSTLDSLPLNPPSTERPLSTGSDGRLSTASSRPGSKCGRRSRILEAQQFAAQHF